MPRVQIRLHAIQWSPQGYDGTALSLPAFSVEVEYAVDPTKDTFTVGDNGVKILDKSKLTVPSEKVIIIENHTVPAVATEGTTRVLRQNHILTGLAVQAKVLLMRRYEPTVPPKPGHARPMFGFQACARISGQEKLTEDRATCTKISPHTLGWKPGAQAEVDSGPMFVDGILSSLVIVAQSEGVSIPMPQGAVYRTWQEIGALIAKA